MTKPKVLRPNFVEVKKVPTPLDRPDYRYWKTSRANRKPLSKEELAIFTVELTRYANLRFVVGRRFKLNRDYCGIPKGTGCVVVEAWPNTSIRWDKWQKSGYGAHHHETLLSFELDLNLEPE